MEFIRERRAIRKFDHTKLVDKATMETLVEAARSAPTALNRQKLIFHPIISQEVIKKFEEIADKPLSSLERMVERQKETGVKSCLIYDAPACIFITLPDDVDQSDKYYFMDIGFAAENIAIAARSLGLDTIMVGCGAMFGDELLQAIGATHEKYGLIVGVGHAAPEFKEKFLPPRELKSTVVWHE